MKQTLLLAALGLAACGAAAQEVGQVLSSTPVIEQVAVPRTYCNQPVPIAQPQTSGGGGLLGAVAGGVLGSTIGSGSGTAAAILIGTVGGAIVGNNIEANSARQAYAQPACTTETSYENRTIGYDVTYEYAGRQYTARMPQDPGPTIPLQVSPVGAGTLPPVHSGAPVIAPPVVVTHAPAPIVVQPYATYPAYAYPAYPPPYPVYAYPAYRPFPVGISLGFHYGGHRHHGPRHRHHRRR
jgi:uncharacterized protein YcfJ